jgi:methionyl-tRNA formyltransferase
MKIAFFWTWEFSKNILNWILKYENINVCLAVSQPNKQVWRKKILTPTPIALLSGAKWIKILQPEKLKNNEEFIQELKKLELDFIVVVAYWKIIPNEILQIPKYSCINIHGSILPKYRWASPIQEAIKNWDTETWLTIMKMSIGMDEWDVLSIEKIRIDKMDKTEDIFKKFEKIWPSLLINTLSWYLNWDIKAIKQDDSKATYCSKINKIDWEIDFKKEKLLNIYNKFRAYKVWPWIYIYYEWKKLNIEDCIFDEIWNFEINFEQLLIPWNVVKINKNNIWIVCYDKKILIIKQIKLEWKKSMDINSFINWNKNFLNYKF